MTEPSAGIDGAKSTRVDSGCPGLDAVLDGGYLRGHFYFLEGDPGAGKTTLGLQFIPVSQVADNGD